MLHHLGDALHHLTSALVAWGPAGILLLAVLDSCGIPVAGVFDALLILIAVERPGVAWLSAGLAVVGSTVGNTILFWTARRGGRRFMNNATPQGWSGRFREWFRRYGMVTVFVPTLMPIPMPLKVFVISAGVTGTSLAEFVGVVFIARIIRYFGEAWLGVTLGNQSASFLAAHAWEFIAGAVVMFAALYAWIDWKDRQRRKSPAI